jgi:hypothetical protein
MSKSYSEKLAEFTEAMNTIHKVEPSYSIDEIFNFIKNGEISFKPSEYETKPKQYKIGIDTFDRLKANASKEEAIGFCKYNIDKYAHRKKGCDKEDIVKIKDYCDLWLWVLENK